MPTTTDCDRYVMLRGGLAVPLAPMLLLLDLETRGFTVIRDGDGLVVRPGGRLTEGDRVALMRWKAHVWALLGYYCGECGRETVQ